MPEHDAPPTTDLMQPPAGTEHLLPAVIDDDNVITDDGVQVPLAMVATDNLAGWVEQLRDARKNIDRCMAILSAEAISRADAAGGRTRIAGDRRWVSVTGPGLIPRYDPEALGRALSKLVVDGVLNHEAIDGLVVEERTWKIDTTRLKQLAKLPAVAKAIAPAAIDPEEPKRRIISTGWKD